MSGAYERDAKVLIGDEAWTKIINAASSGRISAQQMKDVAWALPTDRDKDKIGAEHERRMNEKGTKGSLQNKFSVKVGNLAQPA